MLLVPPQQLLTSSEPIGTVRKSDILSVIWNWIVKPMSRVGKRRYGSPRGKYAPIMLYVVDTEAWRSLGTASHSLFTLLCLEWNGPNYNNNGKIILSVRQAAERMGVSRDTAAKAFRELQAKGFIVVRKGGSLGVTGHGKCPEYEITSIDMPHQDKSNLFLDWTPGNDFDVFVHPIKNPNGKNKSLS